MNLHLQRQQERTIFGSIQYILHVTLILDAEQLLLVNEHRLDRKQLFAVPEKEHLQQRADAAFDSADNRSIFSPRDAGKLITDQLSGLVSATRSKLAFAVTVGDAINGSTIRCLDLYELLDCERQITEGFDELHRDLVNAEAFSIGREQILAPDDAEEPAGPPPADWANPQPRWRQH